MGDKRISDPELRPDVDRMILEFLVHRATEAMLSFMLSRGARADLDGMLHNLRLVQSYLDMTGSHELNEHIPSTSQSLSFRLKLLQFTTLFALHREYDRHPATPPPDSLAELRRSNSSRTKRWLLGIGRGAFPAELLDLCRPPDMGEGSAGSEALEELGEKDSHIVTLLDLVPRFVELTLLRARLGHGEREPSGPAMSNLADDGDSEGGPQEDWATSQEWLQLAGDFMLHAVLDQCGSSRNPRYRATALVEAFAWGPGPWSAEDHQLSPSGDESSDEDMTGGVDGYIDKGGDFVEWSNIDPTRLERDGISTEEPYQLNMLFDLDAIAVPTAESEGMETDKAHNEPEPDRAQDWRRLRRRHVRRLFQVVQASDGAVGELRSRLPIAAFERTMHDFLAGLLDSLTPPLIEQLRNGDTIIVDDEDGYFQMTELEAERLRRLLEQSQRG